MTKKREFKVASWADHNGRNMFFWVEDQHGNKYGRMVPSEWEAEAQIRKILKEREPYWNEAAE
jgi:hypothetical protein